MAMKNERGWYVTGKMKRVNQVSSLDSSITYLGYDPLFEWCEQQFEEPESLERSKRQRWDFEGQGRFSFRDESDMVWFLLRWQ
jgi:hypothetical protein